MLLTRAGFEDDLCVELATRVPGVQLQIDQPGVVWAHCPSGPQAASWPAWQTLAFAREVIEVHAEVSELSRGDRLAILQAHWPATLQHDSVHVYAPDADALRSLAPMTASLQKNFPQRADAASKPSTHLIFLASDRCVLGRAAPPHCAPIASGVPRLKFPAAAPSRSTLKLDEALLHLLSPAEHAKLFQPGMQAVDLGACPGGWTYQLLRRGLFVTAIDNGRMDDALMRTGRVQHLRTDGFRYLPPKPVDWMVCDMVESPLKVSDLAAAWLGGQHCRFAVFNLKLPMKKRAQALLQCLDKLAAVTGVTTLRVKQLFHDREEVTVLVLTEHQGPSGRDKLRAPRIAAHQSGRRHDPTRR